MSAPQPLSVAQEMPASGDLPHITNRLTDIMTWLREPDWTEEASLEWLTDWINRRPIAELAMVAMLMPSEDAQRQPDSGAWRPIADAPRDGSWIIALCNDGTQTYHVYWLADQEAWYGHHGAYGDGLFSPNGGWIPAPAPKGLTFSSTNCESPND